MKEKILALRLEGKSYSQIQKELGCSRSLISYHVNPDTKTKSVNRFRKNRFKIREELKLQFGGKCCLCGYKKCLAALQFHHRNPKEKLFEISAFIWGSAQGFSQEDFQNELKKCDLVCANCHTELHCPDYIES
jgi:5-methylcytosine-specific restriction endonuclease McrA